MSGGEISLSLFHMASEKDQILHANMKSPKLTSRVLHPGSCKQSVPIVALAIFEPSNCAPIKKYFPEKKNAQPIS